MNTVEKIKAELKSQRIPVSRMEKDLGFANGYISQLKKGSMPIGRMQLVAEYLGKPFEYFISDNAKTITVDEMTEEQRKDLERQRKIVLERQKENAEREKETEAEADDLIEALTILKDRPDLRALLWVSKKNTPQQVRRLAALMESMNGDGED